MSFSSIELLIIVLCNCSIAIACIYISRMKSESVSICKIVFIIYLITINWIIVCFKCEAKEIEMELSLSWIQVGTIVGANLGLFLWSVRQSRNDFLYTMRVIEEIKKETKDFHGKLCAFEVKVNQK